MPPAALPRRTDRRSRERRRGGCRPDRGRDSSCHFLPGLGTDVPSLAGGVRSGCAGAAPLSASALSSVLPSIVPVSTTPESYGAIMPYAALAQLACTPINAAPAASLAPRLRRPAGNRR